MSIEGDVLEEDIANVEEYYNGMRETIEALEELIAYFEDYDEDTVIIFFGDHAPKFLKLIFDSEGKELERGFYRTPYMIWSNYEKIVFFNFFKKKNLSKMYFKKCIF